MSTRQERQFYNSARWKKTRKIALMRDGGLCVMCRKLDIITPAYEVDHIKPLKAAPKLALVVSNLQSLCHNCHTHRTTLMATAVGRKMATLCEHGYDSTICNRCGG